MFGLTTFERQSVLEAEFVTVWLTKTCTTKRQTVLILVAVTNNFEDFQMLHCTGIFTTILIIKYDSSYNYIYKFNLQVS